MRTKKLTYILVAGALILSAFTNTAKAGDEGRFSVGAELALPSGTYGDGAGTGFGASLRYEMPMGDNLGLMGTVGYLTFGSKTTDLGAFGSYKYTNSMIPILVGAKYYFTEQQNGFYGMVQLGVSLMSNKTTVDFLGTSTSNTQSSSAFTWSPGVGYHLNNLDFGVGYYAFSYTTTVTSTFLGVTSSTDVSATGSWIGVRVAYVFGGK